VACKSWNELKGEKSVFSENWTNPRFLSSQQYTRVLFREMMSPEGQLSWQFIKRQCMHCVDPACESVCPVGALIKMPEGPVVYDDGKCIGCRYCMMACPYQIPKFEWASAVPLVRKCTFCADRLAMNLAPACVSTCPTGCLLFGERGNLLKEARRRIGAFSGRYFPEIYGDKTAGGASKLYLTALSMNELGLDQRGFRTDLGVTPHGIYGRAWMSKVPWVALGVGGLAVGLHYLHVRRAEVKGQEGKEG
jgi:formate dehydrogenase iron-sulfur subunit